MQIYNRNGCHIMVRFSLDETRGLSCEIQAEYKKKTNRNIYDFYDKDEYNIKTLLLEMRFHYAAFAYLFDHEKDNTFPWLKKVPKEDRDDDDDIDYAIYEWHRRFSE